MAQTTTSTFGFPRIGAKREMKTALESYWAGKIKQEQLLDTCHAVQANDWSLQAAAGISRIGVDGTLYDQVLDTTFMLGLVPTRFKDASFAGLDLLFAMARGANGIGALDMSKYFDTNYHYIVPELEGDFTCKPNFKPLLEKITRAQEVLGKDKAIPLLVGPCTYVLLSKRDLPLKDAVDRLLPTYGQLLRQLHTLGCPEVQILEPSLTTDAGNDAQSVYEATYTQLAAVGLPIDLICCYDDLAESTYPWVVKLPVAAVSLDFCGVPGSAAGNATLELIRKFGFPQSKRLGVGIIDARSVWADDLPAAAAVLKELSALGIKNISVQPSTSLQHLPYTTAAEKGHLPDDLLSKLSFAVEKLSSLKALASGSITPADAAVAAKWGCPPDGAAGAATGRLPGVEASLLKRPEEYEVRRAKQPQFHAFPTSTIGSFPQTAEVRRLRTLLRTGRLNKLDYERLIDQQIAFAIGVQEAVGIDVLVHGEPERTDMVEYFGVQLGGLAFTVQGWVQSYGSRYVRPPIITGDVVFNSPMTVREFAVAQQLTSKPVKGMLTGPVTILNWSFPRKDISRAAQAAQLGLALRQEVDALQTAGCRIIQVDEPALREGLPLKKDRWEGYLGWAVDAFRVSTSVAKPSVQVVTHLCYSDFQDIMAAVDAMDADVLTIENSRSGDAMVTALAAAGYSKDLGPGVYDVHSPQIPDVDWLVEKIQGFVDSGVLKSRHDNIWVNPDCGLKTRRWEEVIPSLRNMVEAACVMRARVATDAAKNIAPAAAAATGDKMAAGDKKVGNATGPANNGCGAACCR